MIQITAFRPSTAIAGVCTACALLVAAPSFADDSATAPTETDEVTEKDASNADPLEPLNRTMSSFNRVVRGLLLDPMVEAYKGLTPPPVQEVVSNITSNLSEPVTAISSALQGDNENAGDAMERFVINTTVGLAGTRDVATDMGVTSRKEDLGQAMGANGVAPGPHIVLPILGPSNMRDVLGDVAATLANPIPLAGAADSAVSYAENKDDIEAATKSALDPYVVERDGYEQHREYVVKNGESVGTDVPSIVAED